MKISSAPFPAAPWVLPSRRRFVQGLACGGIVAGLGLALPSSRVRAAACGTSNELRGNRFDLNIGHVAVNFTGAQRIATVVNGTLPAPTLRWRQGEAVTLRVRNTLPTTSSIHWHGMIVPADMDGVPGLSFMGIAPGETYTYRFAVNQSGTYWYHSHSRFQEQTGLYGAIVIEPRDAVADPVDRDYVVLLSDWSDTDPERIYATLKKHSGAYNFGKGTIGGFLGDARRQGVGAALDARRMWNLMRMDPSDLVDVSAPTYTFLMNGFTPAANWTGLFARGERVRLRIINGSSMSFFDVRIPGLTLRVIAADGQRIEPVSVDELRIGAAETYDVVVQPDDDRAYTIFAQSMDRSGFARGTLAPRDGMHADVPALDPRPQLSMGDMMGQMSADEPMTHDMPMDHASMPGMDHAAKGGMDHAAIAVMRHDAMPGMAAGDEGTIRTGPGVDMTVAAPRRNLDDPGVGLRDNGRRVLTYADLHTVGAPISTDVQREMTLHLTGHMQRYIWSFDATKFSAAQPLPLKYGERVRITLINDTMMTHPIHLHGMWSELEAPNGDFQVRKHTVVVQPGQQISYRVSADALGRWAYHCHLLYHMEAGMFREVVVA